MEEIVNGDVSPKGLAVVPQEKTKLFSFEELEGEDIFSFSGLNRIAAEKAAAEGRTVTRHANGKLNLASVVDDPSSVTNVCPYCQMTFVQKFVLARHIKQIHEKHKLPTFKCPKCHYSTVRKDQMRSHFSVVHENFKPFCCSLCHFRAPKAFRVTKHLENFHQGKGAVIHDKEMRPRPVSPPAPKNEMPNKSKKKGKFMRKTSPEAQNQSDGIDPPPSFPLHFHCQKESTTSQTIKKVITASDDVINVKRDIISSESLGERGVIKIVKANGEVVQVIANTSYRKPLYPKIITKSSVNQEGAHVTLKTVEVGHETPLNLREGDDKVLEIDIPRDTEDGPPEGMIIDQIPLNPAGKGYKHLFKCHMCDYKACDQASFAQHLYLNHDSSRPIPLGERLKPMQVKKTSCLGCGAKFTGFTALYNHLNSKHNFEGVALHLCHICAKYFPDAQLHEDHMQLEHPGFRRCQRCEVCHRAFTSPELLFLHVRRAHRKPVYVERIIKDHNINVAQAIESIKRS